jgi:hypothetical protein
MVTGARDVPRRLGGALAALAALCLLSLAALPAWRQGGRHPSSAAELAALPPRAAAAAADARSLDAGARALMEADIAAADGAGRRGRRAADERAARDAWSPQPDARSVHGPRRTRARARQQRAGRRRAGQQQRKRVPTAAARAEYLRNAPENITWSPYHVMLAKQGSRAHREGKFGIPGGVAQGQVLWKPEWQQEPTGGDGFTLRMYGLNSDCLRGAGQSIVCPRKWIPHDYLTDWDDHGEDDRGGLHSWEGSAVVPNVDATSMSWFTGHIKGSSKSFLAVWWGQLPIVLFDDYEFCCSSARDGIRLFVNGKLLVDNDGRHSRSEKCEHINLDAGNHHIRVDGFQVDGNGGGGTSKICKYRGKDTGGSKVNLKSNDCCTPARVLPIPEGYSGIGYDETAVNNNGAKGEHNMDEGGTYAPRETIEDANFELNGGALLPASDGDTKWEVQLFVFYPYTVPLTEIPKLGDIPPQSYLGDWKEGGPYFSCELDSLPITWGDIDGKAAGISMLPKLAPVAITVGGNFEINVPGEYEFCGESMMGGRLFVSAMKVME